MVRWPGRIEAGRLSDEFFATLDWIPTMASLIGKENRMPVDRPIDGLDQSSLLLGAREKSEREQTLVCIGDDLFAVKWHTFKYHLKTAESRWAPVQTNIFPTI